MYYLSFLYINYIIDIIRLACQKTLKTVSSCHSTVSCSQQLSTQQWEYQLQYPCMPLSYNWFFNILFYFSLAYVLKKIFCNRSGCLIFWKSQDYLLYNVSKTVCFPLSLRMCSFDHYAVHLTHPATCDNITSQKLPFHYLTRCILWTTLASLYHSIIYVYALYKSHTHTERCKNLSTVGTARYVNVIPSYKLDHDLMSSDGELHPSSVFLYIVKNVLTNYRALILKDWAKMKYSDPIIKMQLLLGIEPKLVCWQLRSLTTILS